MVEKSQLLFFDTFVHSGGTALNLDLVNFNHAVFVREVRVIPLGARVCGNLPGGERMGATNPSKFTLDLFINDLSSPGSSVFQKLGSIDYKQRHSINIELCNKTPTDGLVVRGCYSTVTLAVYGVLSQPESASCSTESSSQHDEATASDCDHTDKPEKTEKLTGAAEVPSQIESQIQSSDNVADISDRCDIEATSVESCASTVCHTACSNTSSCQLSAGDVTAGETASCAAQQCQSLSSNVTTCQAPCTASSDSQSLSTTAVSAALTSSADMQTQPIVDSQCQVSCTVDRASHSADVQQQPQQQDEQPEEKESCSDISCNNSSAQDIAACPVPLPTESCSLMQTDRASMERLGPSTETTSASQMQDSRENSCHNAEADVTADIMATLETSEVVARGHVCGDSVSDVTAGSHAEFPGDVSACCAEGELMEAISEDDNMVDSDGQAECTQSPVLVTSSTTSQTAAATPPDELAPSAVSVSAVPECAVLPVVAEPSDAHSVDDVAVNAAVSRTVADLEDIESDEDLLDDETEVDAARVSVHAAVSEGVGEIARATSELCQLSNAANNCVQDRSPEAEDMNYTLPGFDADNFQPQHLQMLPLPWCICGCGACRPRDLTPDDRGPVSARQCDDCVAEQLDALLHRASDQLADTGLVDRLEEISSLLLKHDSCVDSLLLNKQSRVQLLKALLILGVDYNVASSQTMLPHKMRQFKCCVQLCARVLAVSNCVCDYLVSVESGSQRSQSLLHLLLNICDFEHMAVSLKILALRALSAAVNWPSGIQMFVSHSDHTGTCYQRTLFHMMNSKLSRVKLAASTIIRKVHVYREVFELCSLARQIGQLGGVSEQPATRDCSSHTGSSTCVTSDAADSESNHSRSHSEQRVVSKLIRVMEQGLYRMAGLLESARGFSSEMRSLNCVRGEVACDKSRLGKLDLLEGRDMSVAATSFCSLNMNQLLAQLDCSGFIEALLVLLVCPHLFTTASLQRAVNFLLTELMSSYEGLLLLAHRVESTKDLLAILLSACIGDTTEHEQTDQSVAEQCRTSVGHHPLRSCGRVLACRLYFINKMDQLMALENCEHEQLCVLLDMVCSGTLSVEARDCLVHVFMADSSGGLLTCLWRLFVSCDVAAAEMHHCPLALYCHQLLLTVLKHAPNDGTALVELSRSMDTPAARATVDHVATSSELRSWVVPSTALNCVSSLCKLAREQVARLTCRDGAGHQGPCQRQQLLPLLRRLSWLAECGDKRRQLSIAVQMVRAGCCELALSVVQHVLRAAGGGHSTSICSVTRENLLETDEGHVLCITMLSALCLIKRQVSLEISCRPASFNCAAAMSCLVDAYCLIFSLEPPSSLCFGSSVCDSVDPVCRLSLSARIRECIVSALLAYSVPTCPPACASSSMKGVDGCEGKTYMPAGSLWTRMLSTIADTLMYRPCSLLACVCLLGQLLPLRLPFSTAHPLSPAQSGSLLKQRCLWAVHLVSSCSVVTALSQLISTVAITACQAVRCSATCLLASVADLSYISARLVASQVLQYLHSPTATTPALSTNASADLDISATNSAHLVPALRLLQRLLAGAAFKTATVWLLLNNHTTRQAFSDVLSLLSSDLVVDGECETRDNAITAMLGALCDHRVCLLSGSVRQSHSDNTSLHLPDPQLLDHIATCLLSHVACKHVDGTWCHVSHVTAARTLCILCEYEAARVIVQRCVLERDTSLLWRALLNCTQCSDCELQLEFTASCLQLTSLLRLSTEQLAIVLRRRQQNEQDTDSAESPIEVLHNHLTTQMCGLNEVDTAKWKHAAEECFAIKKQLNNCAHSSLTACSLNPTLPLEHTVTCSPVSELAGLFSDRQSWSLVEAGDNVSWQQCHACHADSSAAGVARSELSHSPVCVNLRELVTSSMGVSAAVELTNRLNWLLSLTGDKLSALVVSPGPTSRRPVLLDNCHFLSSTAVNSGVGTRHPHLIARTPHAALKSAGASGMSNMLARHSPRFDYFRSRAANRPVSLHLDQFVQAVQRGSLQSDGVPTAAQLSAAGRALCRRAGRHSVGQRQRGRGMNARAGGVHLGGAASVSRASLQQQQQQLMAVAAAAAMAAAAASGSAIPSAGVIEDAAVRRSRQRRSWYPRNRPSC